MLAWLGFVQPVNVGLYSMARGIAEAARLGATCTWRCRVMFSIRVAETATLGGVARPGGCGKKRADAIGACVVAMFQTRIRQDRAFRIRG